MWLSILFHKCIKRGNTKTVALSSKAVHFHSPLLLHTHPLPCYYYCNSMNHQSHTHPAWGNASLASGVASIAVLAVCQARGQLWTELQEKKSGVSVLVHGSVLWWWARGWGGITHWQLASKGELAGDCVCALVLAQGWSLFRQGVENKARPTPTHSQSQAHTELRAYTCWNIRNLLSKWKHAA